MKKCVVSFADSVGSYQKKMLRLEQSLKGNFDGDFLGFTSYDEVGSKPHSEIPYQFKPYSIKKAFDLGYDQVLWCDSPVYAKKSIYPVFKYIEDYNYLFFNNIGYSLGDYTNDKTLQAFYITRKDSWSIPMIMACVMGFKKFPVSGNKPFSDYLYHSPDLYPGEWNNDDLTESKDMRVKGHRHDQSVMSAIIHKYNLPILKGQSSFFAYETHRQVMDIADSVCLYSG